MTTKRAGRARLDCFVASLLAMTGYGISSLQGAHLAAIARAQSATKPSWNGIAIHDQPEPLRERENDFAAQENDLAAQENDLR